MQVDEVPMPAAVAVRPRDPRGFPVLAITPWQDGQPQFGFTSTERVLICAVERRCAICGLPLDPSEVWRVVAADEALAILDAIRSGVPYVNAAPTVEPPGHRACMLYSAMACPYLARPNARRGQDVDVDGFAAPRGAARGEVAGIGGAVAGFASYEFRAADHVAFWFAGLIGCTPHLLGADHLDELTVLLAATAGGVAGICPPWLLDDEPAARHRASRYL